MKPLFLFIALFIFSNVLFSQDLTPVKLEKMQPIELKAKVIKQDSAIKQQTKVIKATEAIVNIQADRLVAKEKTISELKEQVKDIAFGGIPTSKLLGGLFWVFMGAAFIWSITTIRVMRSKNTKNAVLFTWKDIFNPFIVIIRVLTLFSSIIIALATMVFFKDLTSKEITMFYCFGIGLTLDLLVSWYFKFRQKLTGLNLDNPPSTNI